MWEAVDTVIERVLKGDLTITEGEAKIDALIDIHLPLPERDAWNRSAIVGERGGVVDYFRASIGDLVIDLYRDYVEEDFEANEAMRRDDLVGLR
jgi:hypothetical protein